VHACGSATGQARLTCSSPRQRILCVDLEVVLGVTEAEGELRRNVLLDPRPLGNDDGLRHSVRVGYAIEFEIENMGRLTA
jgi:hypothetical protein